MSKHLVDGAIFSVIHSDPICALTSLEDLTGPHWGAWVFEIYEAHLSKEGHPEDHELLGKAVDPQSTQGGPAPPTVPRRSARLAVVASWTGGLAADRGVDKLCLYFDRETIDPAAWPTLEYVFSGRAGGPWSAFRCAQPVLATADISIESSFAHDQEETQQIQIRVDKVAKIAPDYGASISGSSGALPPSDAPSGYLLIQPLRSRSGKRLRLLNATPEFRDDVFLATHLKSYWMDGDLDIAESQESDDLNTGLNTQDATTTGYAETRTFVWDWPDPQAAVHHEPAPN
jgi:hypothetical protein